MKCNLVIIYLILGARLLASASMGLEKEGYFVSFSLDLEYLFDGNSDLLPEGFKFGNTLSIGYKFDSGGRKWD